MIIFNKHLIPDPPPAGGDILPKKGKIRNIPYGDSDFLATVTDVNASWKINPSIMLLYIKQPAFEAVLDEYNLSLIGSQQTGSQRPSQTMGLKEINSKIDEGVTDVKNYIEKKDKTKNAKPQFPRFGIVKKDKGYKMSKDKDERAKALELMVTAIATDGFGAEKYRTAFWTDIQKKFNDAVVLTKGTDKSVTTSVSKKNESRKTLEKVMKSLIKVLEGNYPDTYPAVLREWGFLKQKYSEVFGRLRLQCGLQTGIEVFFMREMIVKLNTNDEA